jgi:hypothetical protein
MRSGAILPKRCLLCQRKHKAKQLTTGKWLVCPNCQERFWRKGSYIAKRKVGRKLFCSFSCLREGGGYEDIGHDMSEARKGRGNPAYRHGLKANINIRGWKLSRKGETNCRNCGSGERVQLHHVIPRAHSQSAKGDLRNGIPLCGACHTGWHSRMVTIYRDVFTVEEWDYLASVDLVDRDITFWLDQNYPKRGTS